MKPPSRWLLAMEGRAVWEVSWFFRALPLLSTVPRGDGHPVLVLPGFLASDVSTLLLRQFLRSRGYRSRGWNLGRNLGYDEHLMVSMNRRLRNLYWRYGHKVSLVGWSLGGIYARELAREHPAMVRQVISLGSPFGASPRSTNVWRLYEQVSGMRIETLEDLEISLRMREAPPVPSTAIYTRSDGVASWKACLEPESETTDNVEVPGSHCGLGHNPFALYVVADRLRLPEQEWKPFDRSGLRGLLYPTPNGSSPESAA